MASARSTRVPNRERLETDTIAVRRSSLEFTLCSLNLRVGEERPWVQRFMSGRAPPEFVPPNAGANAYSGQSARAVSRDCVAARHEGQTVLIYCPVRRSVDPIRQRYRDLHERGALRSLLEVDANVLNTAIALGEEWLGPNNAILKCLRLGVAVHHGALPTAIARRSSAFFRRAY